MFLFTTLVMLGIVSQTVRGVTPEATEALCAIVGSSCSSCHNPCLSKTTISGKTFYTSGCGEYCDEAGGVITMLDLKDKVLEKLGTEIGVLTDLTYLDLSYNYLSTLPYSIKSLKNLTDLYKAFF